MDFRTYDTAFVTKLGAAPQVGVGYAVEVALTESATLSVPVLFDLPEEWWGPEENGGSKYTLPAINVRRLDLIPDPRRFLPGYRTYEVSTNPETPNTYNRQKSVPVPVILLYGIEIATGSMAHVNAILQHLLFALPPRGFGAELVVNDRSMAVRLNSVMEKTDRKAKEGRKFVWEYTYAVEAWIVSMECDKVPQILQVDVTIDRQDGVTAEEITVDENGRVG